MRRPIRKPLLSREKIVSGLPYISALHAVVISLMDGLDGPPKTASETAMEVGLSKWSTYEAYSIAVKTIKKSESGVVDQLRPGHLKITSQDVRDCGGKTWFLRALSHGITRRDLQDLDKWSLPTILFQYAAEMAAGTFLEARKKHSWARKRGLSKLVFQHIQSVKFPRWKGVPKEKADKASWGKSKRVLFNNIKASSGEDWERVKGKFEFPKALHVIREYNALRLRIDMILLKRTGKRHPEAEIAVRKDHFLVKLSDNTTLQILASEV